MAAVLVVALPSRAADRVDELAERLAGGEDFRIRTQAALALGATGSQRAVEPLCGGLEDSSTTVRAAVAAGLGKLNLGGEECLERRLADEPSSAVKSAIKKALERLKRGKAPRLDANSRYYLAIAKTTDKTGRDGGEVDQLVRKTLAASAAGLEGAVVAPATETAAEAKRLLAGHQRVVGFYLSAKVLKPVYSGGSLSVKIELAVFTYPGKALKGTLTKKLTQQDVSEGDTGSEDELIKMATERVFRAFADNIERME